MKIVNELRDGANMNRHPTSQIRVAMLLYGLQFQLSSEGTASEDSGDLASTGRLCDQFQNLMRWSLYSPFSPNSYHNLTAPKAARFPFRIHEEFSLKIGTI